jgi:hypothetical protein
MYYIRRDVESESRQFIITASLHIILFYFIHYLSIFLKSINIPPPSLPKSLLLFVGKYDHIGLGISVSSNIY